MDDLLASLYLWTRSLHVVAFVAWMAALFYLPRLFVYHAERAHPGSETAEIFKVMEAKLLRVIGTPAMIATWFFGILLVLTPGVVDLGTAGWLHVKLLLVVLLSGFHGWCARRRRAFAEDANKLSGRTYRIANEVPTLALLGIVVLAVVKPF